MSKYDPDKELDDLHRALEAGKESFQRPHLQVEDLDHVAQKYLSASARYDLSKKALQLNVHDDGRVYSAIYLATRVISGDEERAVQYLARVLNDLSKRGLIHSTLAPVSSLELALDSEVRKSVVFCFVLIPQESHDQVRSMYPEFVMQEGDVGRELYDLSPILSDGEFLTTIRISCYPSVPPQFIPQVLQAQIDQHLAVLPKGTRVRKITKLAITDLSIPFEIKFYNKLLPQVKRIELDFRRAVAQISEGYLQNFNLFREIKYFGKDGQEIYK